MDFSTLYLNTQTGEVVTIFKDDNEDPGFFVKFSD